MGGAEMFAVVTRVQFAAESCRPSVRMTKRRKERGSALGDGQIQWRPQVWQGALFAGHVLKESRGNVHREPRRMAKPIFATVVQDHGVLFPETAFDVARWFASLRGRQ